MSAIVGGPTRAPGPDLHSRNLLDTRHMYFQKELVGHRAGLFPAEGIEIEGTKLEKDLLTSGATRVLEGTY